MNVQNNECAHIKMNVQNNSLCKRSVHVKPGRSQSWKIILQYARACSESKSNAYVASFFSCVIAGLDVVG